MQFLANENFPLPSVKRLREVGYDVFAVVEELSGATDTQVLMRAAKEAWVILTFDKDYGELIFRARLPNPAPVVFFRFTPLNPEEPAELLLHLLEDLHLSLDGRFTVVQRNQVRQRPLP
jgi:predicted nuclease of predicted toxin-antitoxin system